MTLGLRILNVDTILANGASSEKVIDRRHLVIGRADAHRADWQLPDATRTLSGEHARIEYRDGAYYLRDQSKNGIYINDARERMAEGAAYRLATGDRLAMGPYELLVMIAPDASPPEAPAPQGGGGWRLPDDRPATITPPYAVTPEAPPMTRYRVPDPKDTADDTPPLTLTPPRSAEDPDKDSRGGGFEQWIRDQAGTPPPYRPAPAPAPAPTSNLEPEPEPVLKPAVASPPPNTWMPSSDGPEPEAVETTPSPKPAPPRAGDLSTAIAALAESAGLPLEAFDEMDEMVAIRRFGAHYRALVDGLSHMMEERARAKHQLGVDQTIRSKNPLKFYSSDLVARALVAPFPGKQMDASEAIQEAFEDIYAHQYALLSAMHGAVRETVARFSPDAIERRAGQRGPLGRLLPGGRKAQLYDAYEREWENLAGSSDEAFLDVFAKAFRNAYRDASIPRRR